MEIRRNTKLEQVIRQFDMEVAESGMAVVGTDWNCCAASAPFSRIYYILEGEGELLVPDGAGTKRLILQPGHCYLIPTGLVFDYRCPRRMKQLFFHVNVSLLSGLDLFDGCGRCWCWKLEDGAAERMAALYEQKEWTAALAVEEALLGVVRKAVLEMEDQGQNRMYSPLLQKMFLLARYPVSAGNTVRSLAAKLNVSESTLSKKCRQETGKTVGFYLDTLLFRQCSKMLISTELSLGEIAEELGFSDQFYFSRFFKKMQGETPSGYRKRFWKERKPL